MAEVGKLVKGLQVCGQDGLPTWSRVSPRTTDGRGKGRMSMSRSQRLHQTRKVAGDDKGVGKCLIL